MTATIWNKRYPGNGEGYVFAEASRREAAFRASNPGVPVYRLGIGDVTLPLSPVVTEALVRASGEMGTAAGFRGYAPAAGYPFLREAIAAHYRRFGVLLSPEEVFVSDGAKSDLGNWLDLFSGVPLILPSPSYPAVLRAARFAGRRVVTLRRQGALPLPEDLPPATPPGVILLTSPDNPTGLAYTRAELASWVACAARCGHLLLFDAAYEAYIGDGEHPHSVLEIPGAETCAVEVGSLSKTAGFTGLRCGWSVIPAALCAGKTPVSALWRAREDTRFNGVAYPVQRAAEAALSDEGRASSLAAVGYYRENAVRLAACLSAAGVPFTGGVHSPYCFFRTPPAASGWAFFDLLLSRAHVVGTPGHGFGAGGDGWFRVSAFGSHGDNRAAVSALASFFSSSCNFPPFVV